MTTEDQRSINNSSSSLTTGAVASVALNELSPNNTSTERLNGGKVGGSSTRSPGSCSSSGSGSGNENNAMGSDGSGNSGKFDTTAVSKSGKININENIKLTNCADNCNANDLQLNNGSSSSISGGELIGRQVPLNLSPDKVDRNRNDDVVIERSFSTNEIGEFSAIILTHTFENHEI